MSFAFDSPISCLAAPFPGRATIWRLRTRTLTFSSRPLLMGIVNVTPDSFSDGGRFLDPRIAVDHALRLIAEGADLIDVGGESTRPYSQAVEEAEELRRVLPVVKRLCRESAVPISIDTSKAAVAEECLNEGAEIVNDITGLAGDPGMCDLVRRLGAGVCVMHMQGTPQTMQDQPSYGDVVEEIHCYLQSRLAALVGAGLDPQRIALDPGIGFGKTHQHNLTLLANCWRLHDLARPLLVGHSRKGYIGKVLGDKEADRAAGSLGVSLSLARQGVQILRVHDIKPVREALLLFEATGGINGRVKQLD